MDRCCFHGRESQEIDCREPVWEPLLDAVGERLTSQFMYMFVADFENGKPVHAYKHIHTRSYLFLDDDGRAYEWAPCGRYVHQGPGARTLRVMTRVGRAGTLVRPMPPAEAELHRLSVEDVYRMAEVGILGSEDRVELIDGVLVDMTHPSPEHSSIVAWLSRHFVSAVTEWEVRVQDVLLVEGGFFVPDLLVIDPAIRDRHPVTAALVIEVSMTTQRHDRWKMERYARAPVGEHWIVDIPARTVAVHRVPSVKGYAESVTYTDGDTVPTLVGAPEVNVTELLGPAP